jgi:hypothetical protein
MWDISEVGVTIKKCCPNGATSCSNPEITYTEISRQGIYASDVFDVRCCRSAGGFPVP